MIRALLILLAVLLLLTLCCCASSGSEGPSLDDLPVVRPCSPLAAFGGVHPGAASAFLMAGAGAFPSTTSPPVEPGCRPPCHPGVLSPSAAATRSDPGRRTPQHSNPERMTSHDQEDRENPSTPTPNDVPLPARQDSAGWHGEAALDLEPEGDRREDAGRPRQEEHRVMEEPMTDALDNDKPWRRPQRSGAEIPLDPTRDTPEDPGAPGSGISPKISKSDRDGETRSGRVLTPEDRTKAIEGRRRRSALVNVRRVPHRRRLPGEVPSLSAAVVGHCDECCGWDSGGLGSVAANVRACPARECWLWPWRSGRLDEAALGPEQTGAAT